MLFGKAPQVRVVDAMIGRAERFGKSLLGLILCSASPCRKMRFNFIAALDFEAVGRSFFDPESRARQK